MPRFINKDFERPPAELVEHFRDMPTSILSDSMNRFQAMEAAIKPLREGMWLVGTAFTVQAMAGSTWGIHQAIALAKPGDVLVVAARGTQNAAIWEHVMTVAARQRGLAGVVLDGCLRDQTENRADTLPIYARGVAPAGPHRGWRDNLNVPIACAGVVVNPGDIVVGDDDGVVVVPQTWAALVLDDARGRIAEQAAWYERLENGETTLDILGIDPI